MSAGGFPQRLAVFAAFAALAVGGSLALLPRAPGAVPTDAELKALETSMVAGARLHPVPSLAGPGGSATFCAECHPLPPHAGSRVADALTNDHAGRMGCLVCHWPSAAVGSRPAPVWGVPAGSPLFLSVLPAERATREEFAALRARATVARRCFERGPGCDGCHRPGGMGAYQRPGAAPGRAAALERLENYFTLAPGEKWYFPQFR